MMRSTPLRVRAVSAALALVAGAGLLASTPASQPASAEGRAGSAVTLRWADGVTGADNATVVEERDTADPRYDEFEDLEVTIGQTENIRAQAIDITWSGMNPSPTDGSVYTNSLQIMQCWAEDDSGPTPETCMFGPDLTSTNRSVADSDPRAGEVADRVVDGTFPFQPVNGGEPLLGDDLPFDRWTTNEVSAAKTDDLGGGELYFTTQDGIDAPHLGCGLTDAGEPRDCWLVIVPRGSRHFNGDPLQNNELPQLALTTLGTFTPSHWANRLQVRLDFEAVDSFCPADAEQRLTGGSQLVASAMYSWQPALCAGDGAVYGYTPTSDAEGRFQLLGNLPGSAGLAFTSAPVRTDDDELGIRHAPVAVSGAAIAFNVDETDRGIVRDLRLTPRLVAKLLTQSYLQDLPGNGNAGVGDQSTQWWGGDTGRTAPPINILADPEYLELNDHDTAVPASAGRLGGVKVRVSGGGSDAVRELWRWIQADAEAAAWLAGEPDDWGMVINPFFEALDLEEDPPADAFPREVDRCFLENEDYRAPGICSLDLLPFTNSFEGSARDARAAATNAVDSWSSVATAPDGTSGWWMRALPQPPGQRFVLAITDTASAAQYGLPTAALENAAGEFVRPTDASLTAGVEAMVPSEVDGVLAVDPEADAPGAYPLTMLTYAAIRGSDEQAARQDYADFLEFAAGEGQTRGFGAGRLPPGYVPLSEQLRAQARAVAADLERPADPEPSDDPQDPTDLVPSGNGSGDEGGEGADGSDSGDAGGGPGPDSADDGTDGGGAAPDPATLEPDDDPSAAPPADGAAGGGTGDPLAPGADDAEPVALATPGEPVGPMQYALLAVLIVGLAGALAGPALLKLGPRHE